LLLAGDVNDTFLSITLLTRTMTRGGREMMVVKWWKMVWRLDHGDVFESAIQNVLDYFSDRVSELFLTYRKKLINKANEGQCQRVTG
jgi:hypothetical protein